MDLNLTLHDDDDDDSGQNRPRIADMLRAFLLHFGNSEAKQAATRDAEKPGTAYFSINGHFISIYDQRFASIRLLSCLLNVPPISSFVI